MREQGKRAETKASNISERNDRIRAEIQLLIEGGVYMKSALGIIAQRYFLAESTVRDVVYDKRRK